ncbi:hypothetical protein B0H14DRAFT_2627434 [Mycena olivaceomarginata]|nr:hypothetical protein B0H14DRAFT_2627434 [Mycena olivaceomarginata]
MCLRFAGVHVGVEPYELTLQRKAGGYDCWRLSKQIGIGAACFWIGQCKNQEAQDLSLIHDSLTDETTRSHSPPWDPPYDGEDLTEVLVTPKSKSSRGKNGSDKKKYSLLLSPFRLNVKQWFENQGRSEEGQTGGGKVRLVVASAVSDEGRGGLDSNSQGTANPVTRKKVRVVGEADSDNEFPPVLSLLSAPPRKAAKGASNGPLTMAQFFGLPEEDDDVKTAVKLRLDEETSTVFLEDIETYLIPIYDPNCLTGAEDDPQRENSVGRSVQNWICLKIFSIYAISRVSEFYPAICRLPVQSVQIETLDHFASIDAGCSPRQHKPKNFVRLPPSLCQRHSGTFNVYQWPILTQLGQQMMAKLSANARKNVVAQMGWENAYLTRHVRSTGDKMRTSTRLVLVSQISLPQSHLPGNSPFNLDLVMLLVQSGVRFHLIRQKFTRACKDGDLILRLKQVKDPICL